MNKYAFLLGLAMVLPTAAFSEQSDLVLIEPDPLVTATSRLPQLEAQSPAPVTVITAEEIRALGIKRIEDALRLVPGMVVGERSQSDIRVAMRGGPAFFNKRLQVLIDGTSVYQPDFSSVDWGKLPISIQNIERIEVVRSSMAPTFGSNAFSGVVNIVTKAQSTFSEQARLQAYNVGDRQRSIYQSVSGRSGEAGLMLSAESFSDDGFANDENGDRRRDDQEMQRLFFGTQWSNQVLAIEFSGLLAKGDHEVQFIQAEQTSFPDIRTEDKVFNLKATLLDVSGHELQFHFGGLFLDRKQRWGSCVPTILFSTELRDLYALNPELALALVNNQPAVPSNAEEQAAVLAALGRLQSLGPAALSPTCGQVNQDYRERALSFEIQDIYSYSDSLRHVAAIGIRDNKGTSETFMGGRRDNLLRYALFNFEHTHNEWVSNFGVMVEDDDISRTAKSGRFSVNYQMSPMFTVKSALAYGERKPDIWEETVDWSYQVNQLDPPYLGETSRPYFAFTESPGGLEPESIVERSLGFYWLIPDFGASVEMNYFNNILTDLISEKTEFTNFNPTNEGSARQQGVDLEVRGRVAPGVNIGMGYGYVDMDASNSYETKLTSTHSGSAYVSYAETRTRTWSLATYASENAGGSPYTRSDMRVSQTFHNAHTSLTTEFGVRYYWDRKQQYFIDYGIYEDNIRNRNWELEVLVEAVF